MELPDHHIRAVLFDLDGVLVDAADWHRDAFDSAIIEYGCEALTPEEHEKDFNGLSTIRKLDMLVELGRLPSDSPGLLANIHALKQKETMRIIHETCEPVQRVIDVVDHAKDVIGTVAVVTNCSRASCELMLSKSGLLEKFDLIITNEDVDGKIKPHPWPYIKARFDLGLRQKEALAIDDTWKGIMSALEASCRTWRLKKFEDLTSENLDALLYKLRFPL
jgi:beta-phosphoglucomutase-like phosphatase (HAD superfamily)